MRIRKNKLFIFFAWLSLLAMFIYLAIRLYSFSVSRFSFWNVIFALLLLFAESHSLLHSLGYIIGAIRLRKPGATYNRRVKLNLKKLPEVSVMVVARNEPKDVLELTFISLVGLDYANKKLVFIDGSDDEYKKENKKLAEKYNIEYFAPVKPPTSKAQALNSFIPRIGSKYFAVFDADQNPMPNFLLETVALAEKSKKIGFVQTPQLYSNKDVSPIAKGAAMQQSIFYESVCESKGEAQAMFCCGTNFLMRTKVFTTFGGFDESSVTEDFATSVKIHSLGYRSVYYNHVRAFGMAPETLPAYFKQQFRWSAGSVGVLRSLLVSWFEGTLKISGTQLWEYFLSATYYFTGWSFFIMMLCPMLYLLIDIPTYFANPYFYIGSFIPYYMLTMITFYSTMRKRHYSWNDVFSGIIMGDLSYPVLMVSTVEALLGRKFKFEITSKNHTGKVDFLALWPWTTMIMLLTIAVIVGLFKFRSNPYAIGINIAWCLYHLFLLTKIFKLNKSPNFHRNEILKFT